MKKVKFIFWLLVAGLAALILYQNWRFVIHEQPFHINLGLYSYQTPPIPNIALLLGFFVAGLLVAILFMLPGRFKARKANKALNQKIKLQNEKNEALEQELRSARAELETTAAASSPAAAAVESPDEGDTD